MNTRNIGRVVSNLDQILITIVEDSDTLIRMYDTVTIHNDRHIVIYIENEGVWLLACSMLMSAPIAIVVFNSDNDAMVVKLSDETVVFVRVDHVYVFAEITNNGTETVYKYGNKYRVKDAVAFTQQ